MTRPIPVVATGIDTSLTGTGVARAQHGPQGPFVHHARMGSKPAGDALADRSVRLRTLSSKILAAAGGSDLVGVEAPAFSKNSGSVNDRCGLWWLVVARLTAAGVPVVEISPNSVKMYATGKGNASKDVVLAEVVRRFGHIAPMLNTNDEADALVITAMCWHHLTGVPLVDLPQTHVRALKAVHWPIPGAEPPF